MRLIMKRWIKRKVHGLLLFSRGLRFLSVGFIGPSGMGLGGGGIDSINKNLVGTLYIDLANAKTKELFWQGEG